MYAGQHREMEQLTTIARVPAVWRTVKICQRPLGTANYVHHACVACPTALTYTARTNACVLCILGA